MLKTVQPNTPPQTQGVSTALAESSKLHFRSSLRLYLFSNVASNDVQDLRMSNNFNLSPDHDHIEFVIPVASRPGQGSTSRLAPPTTLMADSFLTPTMGFTPSPAPIGKPNPYRLAPPNTTGSSQRQSSHTILSPTNVGS